MILRSVDLPLPLPPTTPILAPVKLGRFVLSLGLFQSDSHCGAFQRLAHCVALQNTIDRPCPIPSQPFSKINGLSTDFQPIKSACLSTDKSDARFLLWNSGTFPAPDSDLGKLERTRARVPWLPSTRSIVPSSPDTSLHPLSKTNSKV